MPDTEREMKAVSQTQEDDEYETEEDDGNNDEEEEEEEESGEAATCTALCSLGSSSLNVVGTSTAECTKPNGTWDEFPPSSCCPKQLQLPMFLSKTFHMIDKCDSSIAAWSENGDNFVVKNIEKFAGVVLPLYFKHSNFSSFARQLNFYGFRKLRSEAILTAEVDPSSACYVRFYHENFQRDKPHLLSLIKRATKGDQQSKDDLDTLRNEISNLKEMLRNTVTDYDRKLAELSYECNRRISSMNAEYDKLASLVQHVLGVNAANAAGMQTGGNPPGTAYLINGANFTTSFLPQQQLVAFPQVGSGTSILAVQPAPQPSTNTDMLRSLSQAAVSLRSTESEVSKPAKKRPVTETAVKAKKKVLKVKRTDGKKPSVEAEAQTANDD